MNKITHSIVFLVLPFLGFITLMFVLSVVAPYWITLGIALGVLYYGGLLRSMHLLEDLYLDELIDREAQIMQLQFEVAILRDEMDENGGTYYEDDEPEDEWEDPFLPKDDDDTDYALPTVQHGAIRGREITFIVVDEIAAEDRSNSGGPALSGNGQPGGDAPSEDLMQVPPGQQS